MAKKGDTLIEVTLAIGIFSMVAIAVAALMNNGTSDAQLALETTLTRGEIDAQAEALRFVHDTYISNKEGETQPLSELWNKITENAVKLTALNDNEKTKITKYAPSSCDDALPSLGSNGKAFVLDTHNLNTGEEAYKEIGTMSQATTYPRLIFKDEENSGLAGNNNTEFKNAEGIYVIAVKDPGSLVIDVNGTAEEKLAYYDFYIHTCWYGVGDKTPSTISTEIRLHDVKPKNN